MSAVIALLSAGEAQRLTQRIKLTASSVRDNLVKLRNLVEEAKNSNVWQVLGFPSWTAYLADTLGDEPMRLGREERQELVGYLSGEGLSTRAIAPIVGVDKDTVRRDVRRGGVNTPPAIEDTSSDFKSNPQAIAGPVLGMDGKTYSRPSRSATPPVSPVFAERQEAERAAQQEWNAHRDLYSGIVRASMTLSSYATHDPARLFRFFEPGMFTPIEEREFTVERLRAAATTINHLIEWKEQTDD